MGGLPTDFIRSGTRPPSQLDRRRGFVSLRGGAVGPGRRALALQQERGAAVLLALRRGRRIAGAADGLPRRAIELVLAAVLAGRGDRGRVAAGLALGDLRQLGGGVRAPWARGP